VSKEKKMPKEYAIVVSLMIFFTIVILVGGVRIYLVTSDRLNKVDLANIDDLAMSTTLEMEDYNVRIVNSIKDTYDVDIYYGDIQGLDSLNAWPIEDDKVIFEMLKEVNKVLGSYPKDIIREIESKGYEINIFLVDGFEGNLEAVANRNSIGQMNIYVSNAVNMNRVLHHECYHILDYYIRLESDENLAYLNWEKFNPSNFRYEENINGITSKYVYDGNEGAHFVTLYAKYSEKEDRAETFAEMITADKGETFFNNGEPIKGKIEIIKKVLYNTFESVRRATKLAWE